MKRWIHAATLESRIANIQKKIRRYISNLWYGNEEGKYVLGSDPEMTRNVCLLEYLDIEDPKESFAEWVYDNRDDIFGEFVRERVYADPKMSEEEKKAALDYFYNLNFTDYNRNLYLKRDSSERGIRDILKMIGRGRNR